ncbi:glucosamine-6-phosphate deaminase [Oceanispirochaeta crateris]|uniref:Glucosamine-6-phosphate deaminase n=1 Tax=Oceanispirochaeta crateris TaxID=2518645 RepID=A0A5C1QQT3_9SPIO|nr:6-phosphogluconolactonase [Oceanispirochaeta crateris]QEN09589.1 glucosamine-6-phosphate deaminase [Oceanispirochaeta crateris]
MPEIMKQASIGKLRAQVFNDRNSMGEAVVQDVTEVLLSLLETKATVNILFGAAPSQQEVLEGLRLSNLIPWERINAFHMDEYIGLDREAPQGFGNFLDRALFKHVPFQNVFYLKGYEGDMQDECQRYSELLKQYPLDIVLMGIGENGHLAFNDPPVADFEDPCAVKIVVLDQVCRQQQVNDGCFKSLDEVPKQALTITIPELVRPEYLFCTVPDVRKEKAVRMTLTGNISESCPASILRNVPSKLYLDKESGACLLENQDEGVLK